MPYSGGFPHEDLKVVRGRWDFAVDGGAVSTIAITQEKLPDTAVILGGFVEVDTAVTGAANAEAAVKVEGAGDIVASAVVTGAPWSTTGRKSVIPAFTGATTVKTTVRRDISIVIAVAALTAGAFDVVLFYVQMGD
jgi:hypothetical protein